MSALEYVEPPRRSPILGHFDVVVAGGGPAGCAAAIAAGRAGASTLLVEKDGYLGGQAVAALVCVILSTNGMDFQGIWHEFMREVKRRNGSTSLRRAANGSMRGVVNPEIVKHAWDTLLSDAGVRLLHHAHGAQAIVDTGQVKGLLVETRAGRRAILAKRVIDCTGDGIICHSAGVPWEQGDGTHKYAMALTKVFRLAGINWDTTPHDEKTMTEVEARLDGAIARGEYTTPVITTKSRLLGYIRGKSWMLPEGTGQLLSVLSRVLKVDPLDPWELTEAEREGRRQAWEAADFYQRYVPGCEHAYLLDTSAQIGIRSSRRVHGIAKLSSQDVIQFRRHRDGIARGSWDIDVWPADSFTAPAVDRDNDQWRNRQRQMAEGAFYDIPYGCLVAKGIDNLMMAGRCFSAEHIAESSGRIQQTCMAMGQAAGTAAALSINNSCPPREQDAGEVLALLEKQREVEPAFEVLRALPVVPPCSRGSQQVGI